MDLTSLSTVFQNISVGYHVLTWGSLGGGKRGRWGSKRTTRGHEVQGITREWLVAVALLVLLRLSLADGDGVAEERELQS